MSVGRIGPHERLTQQELPFGEGKYEKLLEAVHTMADQPLFALLEQEGITSLDEERNQWMHNTYYVEEGRTFHTMSFVNYWKNERKPELIKDFERILEGEAETFAELSKVKAETSRQFFETIKQGLRTK